MVTGRKLLLADDSVTIQKVIDLTFSDEGIEVTTVGNGEQAISKLEEIQPDIVLADIFMPGRNGYEVCEHIKRDERYRHIPVVLLVGSFEPFDEAEARRVGADDYLTKPFQSIRQLVNKVTTLISGGGGREDEGSTRDLELPEEVGQKEQSSADIYTADTAPLPKELADKDPAEAAAHLAGHESLDDEMIEAHTANEIAEQPRETIHVTDARPTSPLSFADLEDAGIKASAPTSPEPFQETAHDFKLEEMNEDALSIEPQTSTKTSGQYMTNAAAADEALLDLGDIEPPSSTTEADDFILDLQEEAPAPSKSIWSEAAEPAVEAAVAGTNDFAQAPASTSAHGFAEEMQPAATPEPFEASSGYGVEAAHEAYVSAPGFTESSGIEIPPPEAYDTHETFAPEEVFEQEAASHSFSETASVQETAPSKEAGVETQPEGAITLEQLSPEAIDAIARRAVELLSSKVVEEIAWEVVPQLAELLIKRKLEEEKA